MPTLFEQINAVDLTTFNGAESKINGGEHVVGEMSEELKKLFCLHSIATTAGRKLQASLDEKVKKHNELHEGGVQDPDICIQFAKDQMTLSRQLAEAAQKAEAFKELFWNACRLEFQELIGKSSIGVRDGFKIVWVEEKRDERLMDILTAMESLFAKRC